MKVHVVKHTVGGTIVGVYSSRERAVSKVKSFIINTHLYEITVCDLDDDAGPVKLGDIDTSPDQSFTKK
jgi:hypothetical protein